MNKSFYRAYNFIKNNLMASSVVLVLMILGLVFLVSQIRFEEDISKLIPNNSETKDLQKVLNSVQFTDKIIVNLQKKQGEDVNELIAYATEFVDSLDTYSSEYVKSIQGKVKDADLLNTMDFVYNNLPLFLEESDYKTIASRLKKDSIEAISESNYKTLISPSGIISKNVILKDPLGISFIGLVKLRQLGVDENFVLKNGFLVSKDEKNLLLFISPTYSSSETSENAQFVSQLYSYQEKLNRKYSEKVKSEYFGAVLVAVANAKQIKNDIQFTVGIAFSLLIVIFILFYRKLWIPLILFVPTLFGGLLAVAILFLLRNEISGISLGIGSVLLGVTLDYSLHILTHIRNNETPESLYKDVTQPILMSSLTTSLAFLCLLFLNSQALQDLGIFASISVIGASVFALLFIPVVYKNPPEREVKTTVLDTLANYKFHTNKWLLAGLGLLLILCFFTYNKVTFNNDISKLNYEPSEIKTAMTNLDELTDISAKSIYLATYGKSTEGTLQLNDSIFEKLVVLKKAGKIKSFNSIGALVQSQREQTLKINIWKQFWNTEKVESLKNNLIESGNEIGFKPTTFEKFYDFLNSDFETLKPEDYQQVPSLLLEDFISTQADFTTITTLVKLDDSHSEEVRKAFKETPNTFVIDRQEMNETFLGSLKNDFNKLIGYCVLVVLLILYLFFRSFSLVLVTTVPILITWFVTIGIMGLFQIEFNIFNIIISTFIFGLGIDYSIFMTKGLLKELTTGESVLGTHKTSILLSVLTTILGVGVLIFAKHPALHSISIVSIIGISSAMLISFTVHPLLFKLFIGSKNKRPITLRMLVHSIVSFTYFGLGGVFLSIYSIFLGPNSNLTSFRKISSKFMNSVLLSNPFVAKRTINEHNEDFSTPAIIIANHTSFLDIISIGKLHHKVIFLVNDWVYNSPVFGKAVQKAGFYPVSEGVENSLEHLKRKVEEGFSIVIFPEGTRSQTNKIRRFHKGAFYLAEQLKLDILPILIHGNSEVLPKGSFIIKDGEINLKILPRIKPTDLEFGTIYKKRTKNISNHFKEEFKLFRREMERANYFHKIVLEDFRYKEKSIYKIVKADLMDNAQVYQTILHNLEAGANILHFSEDCGQLDFLMALDSSDRRILNVILDEFDRKMLNNSFITHRYSKLNFTTGVGKTKIENSATIIISSANQLKTISDILSNNIQKQIILLKDAFREKEAYAEEFNLESVYSDANITIFKPRESLEK